jgi:hypothetical protein
MFGKVVTLNKNDYVVSFNEYDIVPHKKFNNLRILKNFGTHERLVSLINELSNIFKNDLNTSNNCNFVSINCTHGGYIPINVSKYYNKIYIYEKNKLNLKYIDTNIEYYCVRNNYINSEIDINDKKSNFVVFCEENSTTQDIQLENEINNKTLESENYLKISSIFENGSSILILPISYQRFVFPDSKIYILSKSNYMVIVPNNKELLKKFNNHFSYYINYGTNEKNETILDYDNLIHLTMIVKNAGDIFEEVLTKNLPIIDRWTILDTGSTDNTIEIIKKVLVGKKKGELYQEPFIDFGASRNRCLELAGSSCKYKLMLDDTYVIEGKLREFLEETRGDQFSDSFSLYITSDDVQYCSNRITKTTSKLKYIYKIHEVIQIENNVNVCIPIEEARIHDTRSDYMEKRTMDRKEYDLKLLFEMVEEYPNDPRHLYYIGQTYNLLKNYELAFEYFMKRVEHPVEGNIQEKLDACFEAARLANFYLNKPWEECEKLYLKSFEMDKTRPEGIYFIGIHNYLKNNKLQAYQYMKKAFEIGYPVHCQYSLKPTLSYHFVPKFLSELCYQFGDYETGEMCCKTFLESKILKNEYLDVMKSWNDIFLLLNKFNVKNMLQPKIPETPYFCFLADGGFNKWSGSTILKQGVGGSETYIIELAKYIKKSGKYNVIVFCDCDVNEIFEGVEYRYLTEFFDFVRENKVEHCIISRYSEYIPFALKSHINNVYFVAHDLIPTGMVFPLEPKFKKVFCLSEWHVQHFTEIFPQLKDITVPFYYGIDKELFDCGQTNKKLYKFIYSSFPHRGLLSLLQIWPRIINKYPSASLYIHCDIEGKWVNENATEHMKLVKELLYSMLRHKKYNIYYMGWTSKEKLAQSWKTADVWFYPCIFKETFCLTALEAAISKTLVVTNNLAALQNTVGDRGVVVPVKDDYITDEWINESLEKLFDVLDNREKREFFVNKNYEWAKNMTWKNRANELIDMLKLYENNNDNFEIVRNNENSKYKYVDTELDYKNMYNWTNDLPQNTRQNYLDVINYFNEKKLKNPKILEIGTYTGVSIINLLELINNSNATVIDKWLNYNECKVTENIEENDIEQTFYKNIKNKKIENKVNVLKGDSFEILMKIVKENEKFDFIYVDGSHKCLDCYTDILLSWELLNVGGILVIDDVLYNKENGILESPFEGIFHFLKKYENRYKILNNEYRLFLEKL